LLDLHLASPGARAVPREGPILNIEILAAVVVFVVVVVVFVVVVAIFVPPPMISLNG